MAQRLDKSKTTKVVGK